MTRLHGLLVVALLASALVLVKNAYEARRLFAELDRLKSEQALLDSDGRRLQTERQTQATHGRVERTARDRLAMRNASPAVTEYVVDSAPARQR
jgi:cell division protein FtsL